MIIDESPKVIPGREVLLVVEVVSAGSSSERNDRVRKVGEYAAVGIAQYWIVDHQPYPRVRVLRLGEQEYIAEPIANVGTLLVAEINADKPFTVSLTPPHFWSSNPCVPGTLRCISDVVLERHEERVVWLVAGFEDVEVAEVSPMPCRRE